MPAPQTPWTFLTNHSHVLICLAENQELRLRDIAERVGITERAVFRILADLDEAGVITRHREGRHNQYVVHRDKPLRHVVEKHRSVGDLLGLLK